MPEDPNHPEHPESVWLCNTFQGTKVTPEVVPGASPEPEARAKGEGSWAATIQAVAALIAALTGLLALILTRL